MEERDIIKIISYERKSVDDQYVIMLEHSNRRTPYE